MVTLLATQLDTQLTIEAEVVTGVLARTLPMSSTEGIFGETHTAMRMATETKPGRAAEAVAIMMTPTINSGSTMPTVVARGEGEGCIARCFPTASTNRSPLQRKMQMLTIEATRVVHQGQTRQDAADALIRMVPPLLVQTD